MTKAVGVRILDEGGLHGYQRVPLPLCSDRLFMNLSAYHVQYAESSETRSTD